MVGGGLVRQRDAIRHGRCGPLPALRPDDQLGRSVAPRLRCPAKPAGSQHSGETARTASGAQRADLGLADSLMSRTPEPGRAANGRHAKSIVAELRPISLFHSGGRDCPAPHARRADLDPVARANECQAPVPLLISL
jgi:hypothetical protein